MSGQAEAGRDHLRFVGKTGDLQTPLNATAIDTELGTGGADATTMAATA